MYRKRRKDCAWTKREDFVKRLAYVVRMVKREVGSSSSGSPVKKAKIATGLNDDGTLTLEMAKKGQRYPEESPGSGDYVFYQTLYNENPESIMALVWCIEHGVFSNEKAKELNKEYLKAKEIFMKTNKASAKATIDYTKDGSLEKKKKKKKKKDTVTDLAGDAGMSIAVSEGIGSVVYA